MLATGSLSAGWQGTWLQAAVTVMGSTATPLNMWAACRLQEVGEHVSALSRYLRQVWKLVQVPSRMLGLQAEAGQKTACCTMCTLLTSLPETRAAKTSTSAA